MLLFQQVNGLAFLLALVPVTAALPFFNQLVGRPLALNQLGSSWIGLGLVTGRWLRATILLMLAQMAGTVTPLLLFPRETFTAFPVAPTLEGQYIIKNLVLISAAMAVGGTVRKTRDTT